MKMFLQNTNVSTVKEVKNDEKSIGYLAVLDEKNFNIESLKVIQEYLENHPNFFQNCTSTSVYRGDGWEWKEQHCNGLPVDNAVDRYTNGAFNGGFKIARYGLKIGLHQHRLPVRWTAYFFPAA